HTDGVPSVDPRFDGGILLRQFVFGRRDQTFVVAEPEAEVVIRFGASVRIVAGAGYRAASLTGLSGASGSLSVQVGR
ncbi:MAG: hypothetical protein ACRD1V_04875, partial [Vicinamibacterales bacterium]